MSPVDVACTPNATPIDITIENVNGQTYSFTISAGRALVDKDVRIRFFMLEHSDGEEHGYLLHPYHKATSPFVQAVSWTLGFLGSYGLSRQRGELIKLLPKNTHPSMVQAVDLVTYLTFSTVGSQIIKSFAEHMLHNDELEFGYHDIITDKLTWLGILGPAQ